MKNNGLYSQYRVRFGKIRYWLDMQHITSHRVFGARVADCVPHVRGKGVHGPVLLGDAPYHKNTGRDSTIPFTPVMTSHVTPKTNRDEQNASLR